MRSIKVTPSRYVTIHSRANQQFRYMSRGQIQEIVRQEFKSLQIGFWDQLRNQAWFTKVTWATVLILCIALSLYQLNDRFSYFLSTPISVQVKITVNNTVFFPAFTLCNNVVLNNLRRLGNCNNYRQQKVNNSCTSFKWCPNGDRQLNFTDLWIRSKIKHENIRTFIKANRSIRINLKYTQLPYGTCTTFIIDDSVLYTGRITRLEVHLAENESDCESRQYYAFVNEIGDYPCKNHPLSIATFDKIGISMVVKQFKLLKTRNFQCSNDEDAECYQSCLKDTVIDRINCSLPFMDSDYKKCSSVSEAAATLNLFKDITTSLMRCNCPRKCSSTNYPINRESFPEANEKENKTMIAVYFRHNNFQVSTENLTYSWIALFCDIGGTLGLFLGLSLFSIFQYIQTAIIFLFQILKKKIY